MGRKSKTLKKELKDQPKGGVTLPVRKVKCNYHLVGMCVNG